MQNQFRIFIFIRFIPTDYIFLNEIEAMAGTGFIINYCARNLFDTNDMPFSQGRTAFIDINQARALYQALLQKFNFFIMTLLA